MSLFISTNPAAIISSSFCCLCITASCSSAAYHNSPISQPLSLNPSPEFSLDFSSQPLNLTFFQITASDSPFSHFHTFFNGLLFFCRHFLRRTFTHLNPSDINVFQTLILLKRPDPPTSSRRIWSTSTSTSSA